MTSVLILILAISWIFPSAIAFSLLLFFKTHAIVEYASLFGLKKLVKADEFRAWEEENPEQGYPIFLREQHNNFFTRLLGCPFCLATWLSLFAAFFIDRFVVSFGGITIFIGCYLSIGFVATLLYFWALRVYNLAFAKVRA